MTGLIYIYLHVSTFFSKTTHPNSLPIKLNEPKTMARISPCRPMANLDKSLVHHNLVHGRSNRAICNSIPYYALLNAAVN